MVAGDLRQQVYGIGVPGLAQPTGPELMGFKAYNLWRLAQLNLPVPPAIVFGTPICRAYWDDPEKVRAWLAEQLPALMHALGVTSSLTFGAPRRPLLVSVRSGAPVSMPGMLDTVLNIGLCEDSLRGFLRLTGNPRLVWDSYRRLVQQFAEVVRRLDPAPFRRALTEATTESAGTGGADLDFLGLTHLARAYLEYFVALAGQPFPQDSYAQLGAAIAAVFESWHNERAAAYRQMHRIADDLGTAVTVQRMVFGNAGSTSGAGVGFTRDPSTGENRRYVDFLFNAQGEDVVSGRFDTSDWQRLTLSLPAVAQQLDGLADSLEREFGDVQEFEFTVQEGTLFLLQTRAAKRTPWAILRTAVDMADEGVISRAAAQAQLSDIDIGQISRRHLAAPAQSALGSAIPAGTGVATGAIALDSAMAQRMAAAGQAVVLVCEDIVTEDFPGIAAATGILCARGSRTAHAAVVARQLGKVCLVGCSVLQLDSGKRTASFGGRTLAEGEVLTLDADGGLVFPGEVEGIVEYPTEYLVRLEKWRGGG